MATLDDPAVKALLDAPNYAVISTFNPDGSIHSTVVWQEVVDGALSMNSAVGRHWPGNLDADPRITVLVMAQGNPYEYVEIRGTATATADGADAQIDRLAKKYSNWSGIDDRVRCGQLVAGIQGLPSVSMARASKKCIPCLPAVDR